MNFQNNKYIHNNKFVSIKYIKNYFKFNYKNLISKIYYNIILNLIKFINILLNSV